MKHWRELTEKKTTRLQFNKEKEMGGGGGADCMLEGDKRL